MRTTIAVGLAALGVLLTAGCETAIDMAVGSQIDGVWKGKFYCAQGLPLNATLDVSLAGSAATGKVTLGVPRGNLDAPGLDAILSSYTLNGTFDAPNLHLALQPVSWIEGAEPSHQMRPIDATLRTDGKTLELKRTQGCSETLLTKQ
jgi:hypothetical protein